MPSGGLEKGDLLLLLPAPPPWPPLPLLLLLLLLLSAAATMARLEVQEAPEDAAPII